MRWVVPMHYGTHRADFLGPIDGFCELGIGNHLVDFSQMETSIDSVGRIVVPKPLRDALGLAPGSRVDISRYGAGLQLLPSGRTARLVEESGVLVATADTAIDDDDVFELIDAGRR